MSEQAKLQVTEEQKVQNKIEGLTEEINQLVTLYHDKNPGLEHLDFEVFMESYLLGNKSLQELAHYPYFKQHVLLVWSEKYSQLSCFDDKLHEKYRPYLELYIAQYMITLRIMKKEFEFDHFFHCMNAMSAGTKNCLLRFKHDKAFQEAV